MPGLGGFQSGPMHLQTYSDDLFPEVWSTALDREYSRLEQPVPGKRWISLVRSAIHSHIYAQPHHAHVADMLIVLEPWFMSSRSLRFCQPDLPEMLPTELGIEF